MRKMDTTEFEAKFDEALESVESTGEPILVTENGQPLVMLVRCDPAEISEILANRKPKKIQRSKRSGVNRGGKKRRN